MNHHQDEDLKIVATFATFAASSAAEWTLSEFCSIWSATVVLGACIQASPAVVSGLLGDEIGKGVSEKRLTLPQGSR